MFVFDTESPRFKSALRSLQYAVLTFLVVGGTIILVYSGQGYDFNRATGQVIQNGLLLINTQPEDSLVRINDQAEADQTPGRFALPTGEYDVWLSQTGYKDWRKRVNISPSGVEWLYYPLLIPTELVTSRVGVWRNLEFVVQAPNAETVLVRQAADTLSFSLLSLDGKAITNDKAITLPATILGLAEGDGVGKLEFVEWTNSSRHCLLSHTQGESTQYLWLDTEVPAQSVNLNQLFDLPLNQPHFIGGVANELLALVDGDLRRFNINQRTISAPIARGVSDYKTTGNNRVIYSFAADGITQLGLQEDDQTYVIVNKLPGAPSRYDFDAVEFDRDFYVALLDTGTGQVSIRSNPQNSAPNPQTVNLGATGTRFVSFSKNGQFVMAQGGGNFVSYDLDRSRTYNFSSPFAQPTAAEIAWMDGYRLLGFDQKNRLYVFEFDGANVTRLITANPAFPLFFAPESRALYSVSAPTQSPNSFLLHTALLVEATN